MKQYIFVILIFALAIQCTGNKSDSKSAISNAEVNNITLKTSDIEEEIKVLSKQKWEWMANKDVEELAVLFDDKSKFVHMSGTWKKEKELDIIKTGSIWYKEATVHDVAVEVFDNTVILWNRITLVAHVRGSDVSNEFTVTEIYHNTEDGWKLLDLTFSKVRDTHEIEH